MIFENPLVLHWVRPLVTMDTPKSCRNHWFTKPHILSLHFTLPETNIAAENSPSQKETSIPTMNPFSGAMLVSSKVGLPGDLGGVLFPGQGEQCTAALQWCAAIRPRDFSVGNIFWLGNSSGSLKKSSSFTPPEDGTESGRFGSDDFSFLNGWFVGCNFNPVLPFFPKWKNISTSYNEASSGVFWGAWGFHFS